MTKQTTGFLSQLRDRFPVSRAEARRQAHLDIIKAARVQVTKGVMLSMQHALAQRNEPLTEPELLWWKAETAKWETIWRMLNEASSNLNDFVKLSELHKVSEAAFALYEQMTLNAAALTEVPAEDLRAEAGRWRETATLIASLHRHCIMGKLEESQRTRKNTGDSGITDVKEA